MKYSEIFRAHEGKVSDKWSSYLNFYDALTADFTPKRILEIGVQNGGSLEIWAKKFPTANLVLGIDVDPKCDQLTFAAPSIKTLIANAAATETIEKISQHATEFDLIVDDGSHDSKDIIQSLINLLPLLAAGGKYVIEDLHASYWPTWHGGLLESKSAINFLKRLIDVVNFEHWGNSFTIDEYFMTADGYQYRLPAAFRHIKSIKFVNSICLIEMGNMPALLGERIVRGHSAEVVRNVKGVDASISNPEFNELSQAKRQLMQIDGIDAILRERDEALTELGRITSSKIWKFIAHFSKSQ